MTMKGVRYQCYRGMIVSLSAVSLILPPVSLACGPFEVEQGGICVTQGEGAGAGGAGSGFGSALLTPSVFGGSNTGSFAGMAMPGSSLGGGSDAVQMFFAGKAATDLTPLPGIGLPVGNGVLMPWSSTFACRQKDARYWDQALARGDAAPSSSFQIAANGQILGRAAWEVNSPFAIETASAEENGRTASARAHHLTFFEAMTTAAQQEQTYRLLDMPADEYSSFWMRADAEGKKNPHWQGALAEILTDAQIQCLYRTIADDQKARLQSLIGPEVGQRIGGSLFSGLSADVPRYGIMGDGLNSWGTASMHAWFDKQSGAWHDTDGNEWAWGIGARSWYSRQADGTYVFLDQKTNKWESNNDKNLQYWASPFNFGTDRPYWGSDPEQGRKVGGFSVSQLPASGFGAGSQFAPEESQSRGTVLIDPDTGRVYIADGHGGAYNPGSGARMDPSALKAAVPPGALLYDKDTDKVYVSDGKGGAVDPATGKKLDAANLRQVSKVGTLLSDPETGRRYLADGKGNAIDTASGERRDEAGLQEGPGLAAKDGMDADGKLSAEKEHVVIVGPDGKTTVYAEQLTASRLLEIAAALRESGCLPEMVTRFERLAALIRSQPDTAYNCSAFIKYFVQFGQDVSLSGASPLPDPRYLEANGFVKSESRLHQVGEIVLSRGSDYEHSAIVSKVSDSGEILELIQKPNNENAPMITSRQDFEYGELKSSAGARAVSFADAEASGKLSFYMPAAHGDPVPQDMFGDIVQSAAHLFGDGGKSASGYRGEQITMKIIDPHTVYNPATKQVESRSLESLVNQNRLYYPGRIVKPALRLRQFVCNRWSDDPDAQQPVSIAGAGDTAGDAVQSAPASRWYLRAGAATGGSSLNPTAVFVRPGQANSELLLASCGLVQCRSRSVVVAIDYGQDLEVFCLDSKHTSDVQVAFDGKVLSVPPGKGVTLTKRSKANLDNLKFGHGIAYRNERELPEQGTISAFAYDFSIPSAIALLKPLRTLLSSGSPGETRIAHSILKNAVILAELSAGDGQFKVAQ